MVLLASYGFSSIRCVAAWKGIKNKREKKEKYMVAYEIYYRDKTDNVQLVGILPERRKRAERITKDSVLNWGGN